MMVEQVSKRGDDAWSRRRVVVRPKERSETLVLSKGTPDPAKRVRMNLYVGVDEDEHIRRCLPHPTIARRSWPKAGRLVYDDDLFGALRRVLDRRDTCDERGWIIRRRNDRRQR